MMAQDAPGSRIEVDAGTALVNAWIVDGVGVIELNRPERRNALHPDMFQAVPSLIERFDDDDAVRCLLVTGAGNAFCAGGDVKAGADRNREAARAVEHGEQPPDEPRPLVDMTRMVIRLYESPKISIAALPGPAVGAGIGIALAADVRIAARSASLVTAWADLGFSGDFGGPWFLTRMLGAARATEVLIGSATIDSSEAKQWGLFNRVVPDEELRDRAMDWAREIAAGPQPAYRFMKQNVRDAQVLPLREALPRESDRMLRSGETEEHRQAIKRWLEEARAKRSR